MSVRTRVTRAVPLINSESYNARLREDSSLKYRVVLGLGLLGVSKSHTCIAFI